MITEDYVSFEVAKLLNEKGFDYQGFDYIDFEGEVIRQDRPTHQMAMAWLREAHNVSIEPFVDYGSGDDYWWTVDITKIKKNGLITELSGYKSYEEAVEAACIYALKNLI